MSKLRFAALAPSSLLLSLTLAGCRTPQEASDSTGATAQAPAQSQATGEMPAGIDPGVMNAAVDPCEDFYQYACGNWLAKTPIPADEAVWGRGFDVIYERNETLLHALLEEYSKAAPKEVPYGEQLGAFYASCMDEPALEQGLTHLRPDLDRIARVKPGAPAVALVAALHARGNWPFFKLTSSPDLKNTAEVIGDIDQAGLGLPDRDYYLKDDAPTAKIRESYGAHLREIFGLLGQKAPEAEASAKAVIALETELARSALSRVDRRDPYKIYHRIDRAGLKREAPQVNWDAYLKAVGAPALQKLNVAHIPYAQMVAKQLASAPAASLRAYLTFHLVNGLTLALPKAFQEASFRFYGKTLSGSPEDKPRWKKCVAATDGAMGEALARPFVERTFGAEGKATTQAMVKAIEQAFERNVKSLSWMDAETQQRALAKASAIANKIGYPDRWRSYDSLKVERGQLLGNLTRASAFEVTRKLAQIDKPLDRGEWQMSPPTVNAYYEALLNEIVFPAGILQHPFFDRKATDAVNFGAMGMVVGHEITHGFDDQGRQFGPTGNLEQWWTGASEKAYLEKVACVVRQFEGYTAIDELKLNGRLTLGENVADLGGLKIAHAAMEEYLRSRPAQAGGRFTPSQQFFLGFAQSWCTNVRPEAARVRVRVDPHSPPMFRVNGPLGNLPEFQRAFGCKAGQKMVRPQGQRCEVW